MTSRSCKTGQRRRLAGVIAGIFCLLASSLAMAQSDDSALDTTAPVIELEELAQVVANVSQVFTVQIEEETELLDAILYYRRSGEQSYTVAVMSPLGNSGFYTASVTTDPTDLRSIEYYVQARDTSGNRTVSGFAFDPYERTMAPAQFSRAAPDAIEPDASLSENSQIQASTPFYKKRWVQVTLGVVAVGIAASMMDSGGDNTQRVPVRITLE